MNHVACEVQKSRKGNEHRLLHAVISTFYQFYQFYSDSVEFN